MELEDYETQHVDTWVTQKPTDIQGLIDKYRPKEIRRYDENGKLVRVFEHRWCV